MKKRKELKCLGRRSLKAHWLVFVALCLTAAFLGSEFTGSLTVMQKSAETASGQISISIAPFPFNLGLSGGLSDVLRETLYNSPEEGMRLSMERQQEAITKAENGPAALGRSRGVLARIVNSLTSGSMLVVLVSALRSVVGSSDLVLIILILAGAGFVFLKWLLLENMFSVIVRRIYLEGRCYEKVSPRRILYLLRIRKWFSVCLIMFVCSFYQAMWWLTLIGGLIKKYSYFLVPYIAAENPGLSPRQAITLSRNMMRGHKWQCFCLQVSFLWWNLLSMMTMGIAGILYVNPYKTAVYCEYYAELRRLAIQNRIPGTEVLCDRYLFEQADDALLQSAYPEVFGLSQSQHSTPPPLNGIRRFLARWLGISILNRQENAVWEEWLNGVLKRIGLEADAERRSYPTRLCPFPEAEKRRWLENLHYLRAYTPWNLILIFFIFCMIGWLWEVSLHLVTDGQFVNRGVLHGPWLPIYGSGGILILTLLNRFRRQPFAEFICIVVLCGIVEYVTAWYLEILTHGQKWWDYTGYFLNLHGRICAEGLFVFGVGGMLFVYLLAPLMDTLLKLLSIKIRVLLCVVLLLAFTADLAFSCIHPNQGEGISSGPETMVSALSSARQTHTESLQNLT